MFFNKWFTCKLEEIIAYWELDVIQSKWNKQYTKVTKKQKEIILNPNLSDKEHVKVLKKLALKDGVIDKFVKRTKKYKFYKKILTKREFLNLKWCSHSSKVTTDDIDLITNKTRKLKHILRYIKKYGLKINDHQYLKRHILYNDKPNQINNRLYIYKGIIVDGNHRAGANLMSIYEKGEYFPVTCYKIKKVKKRK